MRIVFDFHAYQSLSSTDVERHALTLAHHIAWHASQHDVWILADAGFPDSVEAVQSAFIGVLPPQNIRALAAPAALLPDPSGDASGALETSRWREEVYAAVRAFALAELDPDVVLLTGLPKTETRRCQAGLDDASGPASSTCSLRSLREILDHSVLLGILLFNAESYTFSVASRAQGDGAEITRDLVDLWLAMVPIHSLKKAQDVAGSEYQTDMDASIVISLLSDSDSRWSELRGQMPGGEAASSQIPREFAHIGDVEPISVQPQSIGSAWDEAATTALAALESAWIRKARPMSGSAKYATVSLGEPQSLQAKRTARYDRLLRYIRAIDAPTNDGLLHAAAAAIASSRAPTRSPRIFVDVSVLARIDIKSGIQRVTRAVLGHLLKSPPLGWEVWPVRIDHQYVGYRFANDFLATMGGEPRHDKDDWIDIAPGDIFLGLDFVGDAVPNAEDWFILQRRRGVRVYFVVYDLLPVLRPEWFPAITVEYFPQWLKTTATVADGLIGISRAVTDDLAAWLDAQTLSRKFPLKLGYFHLGADIESSKPSNGVPGDAPRVLKALSERPTILMVGTIEPRKGHVQALAAFEHLWARGVSVNLVLVGKVGWKLEGMDDALRAHPQLDKQLFWLEGISDEYLAQVYQAASALLIASEGEGFGLPLIEAAQKGLPIIARDLAVFYEIAGPHAFYFSGETPEALSTVLQRWLALHSEGAAPSSKNLPWLTWEQSTRALTRVIFEEQWYRHWQFGGDSHAASLVLVSERESTRFGP